MSGGVGSGGHGWRVMSPGEAYCMYCGRCCWVFKWFPLNARTSFYMPLFTSRNFWPFVRAQQQEEQKQQQQSTRFDNRSISLNNQAMSHAAATAAKKNATLDQNVEASSKFLSPEAKRGWKINTPTHTHSDNDRDHSGNKRKYIYKPLCLHSLFLCCSHSLSLSYTSSFSLQCDKSARIKKKQI